MGFEQKHLTTPSSTEPLWKQYRHQFPVTERLIYLNHAAVTPLPRTSAEAMQGLAQDSLDFGSLHYDKWLDTYERLRVAAARLIGADRSEIALVKNTSEGIATVAMGLTWHLRSCDILHLLATLLKLQCIRSSVSGRRL